MDNVDKKNNDINTSLIKIEEDKPTKLNLVHVYEYEKQQKTNKIVKVNDTYIQCMRQYQYDRMLS